MANKPVEDHLAYPPRGMDAERAARYVGTGKTKFLELVQDGRMPQPFRYEKDMPRWDRLDLDAAIEDAKDQRCDPRKRERAKLQDRLEAIKGDE
jgi:predicted DNA-binding transcriptional regulator AlpA